WRPLLLDSRLQHHDPSPSDDESGIDRTEPLRCTAFRPPLSLNRPTSSSSSVDISIRDSERWLKPRLHFVCLYSNIKWTTGRSEEHTSELQSRFDLVCRLLLEKKIKNILNKNRKRE